MTAFASLLVIGLAIIAILRRAEVRLTLAVAALALGVLSGQTALILQTFLGYFTSEHFLLPLGCCMGFAYVLKHTECDRHLVNLLLRPLVYVRPLLVPGVVLVGALVNVPIVSQGGTIVAVGAVLVPVLRAANVSRSTSGAALLLGASIGGEMLNPGAPEYRTVSFAVGARSIDCVAATWPLLLLHLAVTVPLFWLSCWWADRHAKPADLTQSHPDKSAKEDPGAEVSINYIKAMVPLVPLAILFLTALPPPFRVWTVPEAWLVPEGAKRNLFDSRLVGTAMLIGVVVAALVSPGKAGGVGRAFFEGAGYALANIVSVIVVANCFGKGVEHSGLVEPLHNVIAAVPALLIPAAAVLPMAFAWLCGSGMASTQSLYGFFVEPAAIQGIDPLDVGGVVSLSAAAGRTLSPVAAVVLLAEGLTGAERLAMLRRIALPLLAGVAALVVLAIVRS